jgi:hypothetical protein
MFLGQADGHDQPWSGIMLAEKFFLMLEALKRSTYSNGAPRVTSTSPHVPVQLPNETAK